MLSLEALFNLVTVAIAVIVIVEIFRTLVLPSISDKKRSEGNTQTLGGAWHSHFSQQPLLESFEFALSQNLYILRQKKKNGNKSVFKAHPGLRAIFLTDHAAATVYFNAPTTILDRESVLRFGPLRLSSSFMQAATPALPSGPGNNHDAARALTLELIHMQSDRMKESIVNSIDACLQTLFAATTTKANEATQHSSFESSDLEVLDRSNFLGCTIMFNWILEIDSGFEVSDFAWMVRGLFKYDQDTFVSKIIALSNDSGVDGARFAKFKKLKRLVRTSRHWSKFQEMAREKSIKDLDIWLVATFVGFGIGVHVHPALVRLASHPELIQELRKELGDSWSWEMAQRQGITNYPLFDSTCYEVLRLYPGPPFFTKVAMVDFALTAGDGLTYEIKKGQRVIVSAPFANQDPSVFGASAEDFDPRRFIASPELKSKLFIFGIPATSPAGSEYHLRGERTNPYGCVGGENGVALSVFKAILSKIILGWHYEVDQKPLFIKEQYFGSVGPVDIRFKRFVPLTSVSEEDRLQTAPSSSVSAKALLFQSDIHVAFDGACSLTKTFVVVFKKSEYVSLYSLYKQARNGDAPKKSGQMMASSTAKVKWNAWVSLRGMAEDTAKLKYVEMVRTGLIAQDPTAATEYASLIRVDSSVALETTQTISSRTDVTFTVEDLTFQGPVEHRVLMKTATSQNMNLALTLYLATGSNITVSVYTGSGPGDIEGSFSLAETFKIVAISLKSIGQEPDHGINKLQIRCADSLSTLSFDMHQVVPASLLDPIWFPSKHTELPCKASGRALALRNLGIQQMRQTIAWGDWVPEVPNITRLVNPHDPMMCLPNILVGPKYQDLDVTMRVGATADEESANYLPSVESYKKLLLSGAPAPTCLTDSTKDWDHDDWFCDSLVSGVDPTQIQVLSDEGDCPLKSIDVSLAIKQLDNGDTLEEAKHRGCLWTIKFDSVAEVIVPMDRYLPVASAFMYYSVSQSKLVPLGILFDGIVVQPNSPNVNRNLWNLAKMTIQLALNNRMQVINHYFFGHHIIEIFATSMLRNLSSAHPIYNLLFPHFSSVRDINILARRFIAGNGETLVNNYLSIGTAHPDWIAQECKTTNLWEKICFPRNLASRGFSEHLKLPPGAYPYMEDGILLWTAIETYTKNVVSIFYYNDDAVNQDKELSNWMDEINEQLSGFFANAEIPRGSISALVEFLTTIIFHGSITHATMNYNMYKILSYIPFAPSMLRKVAFDPNTLDEATLLRMLPSEPTSKKLIHFARFLSLHLPDDETLVSPQQMATTIQVAFEEFKVQLGLIEELIKKRNDGRRNKYDILIPSLLPKGVDM
ncbi:UNVERIFIED_CONTAM: hypothetical protein HDU68_009130 [Siphonaria sp. JEL0065]|nr:hypothetical protein HDU68_009130 [Siphonaria sp. JEL0065]